jgi:uncharacterized protein (TIGR02271 family)
MTDILVATFPYRDTTTSCINRLREEGIPGDDIGVVMRSERESREYAAARGVRAGVVGGNSGGLLGELRGWFEGLAGNGEGGAEPRDGLVQRLVAHGLSEADARWCRERVEADNVLLSVRPGDRYAAARTALSDFTAQLFGGRRNAHLEETRLVPLVEEGPKVNKRTVERGQVFVTKSVAEEQRRVHLSFGHEEILVERRLADRETDQIVGQVETFRIPLREERVELVKRPRVVEELIIRKRLVTEERDIRATVRREVPRVQATGEVKGWVHDERRALRAREAGE